MKKYLITCTILILSILAYFYLSLYTSIYIRRYNNAKSFITTNQKEIILNKEKFEIHAINLDSSIPGHSKDSYSIDYNTYIRYFNLIVDANFNTIRVFNISSPTFYKALYDFNKTRQNPLYLIQGTDVGNYEKNSSYDYFSTHIKNDLIKNIKIMIDCIHGRRIVTYNNEYSSGIYKYDVSKYVIAYVIGSDWVDSTVEYTNQLYKENTSYKGKYLYTDNSTPFERFLTEIGDELIKYETYKYGVQRIVSFGNEAITDPFDYDESTTDYFNKFTKIDIEHIKQSKNYKSGLIASYQVFSFYPDYYSTTTENSYLKYLEQLEKHHTMPVLITEFGYSTARAISSPNSKILTEKQQGEKIIEDIEQMKSVGIKNYILYEWADEWDNSIWNTIYATDISKSYLWHNVETYNQSYGLLKYVSKNSKKIDGKNNSEYDKIAIDDSNYKMYADYDYSYLYLFVESKKELEHFFIPIDTTPKSGSSKSNIGDLKLNRNIDFVIDLDISNKNSRMYVQDYYNPIRAVYGKQVYKHDQYDKSNIPKKNSSNFEQILLLTSLQKLVTDENIIRENVVNQTLLPSYLVITDPSTIETGYLEYGTDYSCDKNSCEIRIPWHLLNFYNPATMNIHDDYYKNYGVENIKIDSIYIGVGTGNIKLKEFKLFGWNKVETKEVLKDSYNVIKKYQRKEE